MKKKFLNQTLKRKIILAFSVVLILNALISGMAYYSYASNATIQNYENSSRDMVTQMNIHLSEKFAGITQKVNALSSNMSFVNPLRTFLNGQDEGTDAVLAGNIADMISEIRMTDEFVDSMYIYTEKALFDDYILTRNREKDFHDTVMYQYFKEHPELPVAWFPAMENPLYLGLGNVIPVVYRKVIGNNEVFFVINISQDALEEYLDEAYASFDRVFLIDKTGNRILGYEKADREIIEAFHTQTEKVGGVSCLEIRQEEKEYLVTGCQIDCNEWEVYALMAKESLTGSLKDMRLFIVLATVGSGLICLFVILRVSGKLTSSLKLLSEKMQKVDQEDYQTEFIYPYEDEVGKLAGSYNYMLEQIRNHIKALEEEKERVREIQKQKRKVELQALQAQINPHFLYNTLNMITWQAVDQGAEDISVISNALGKYFRISLSRGSECITIREEMEHARSYLEIQKIRYSTKLNYEFEIPQEIDSCQVVKLVLQPLVENALYHGIKVKEGKGNIWIFSEVSEKAIRLIVEDDGCGIDQQKLEILNAKLEAGVVDSSSGYGIYNVNNRLRLYYGEEYGLKLEPGKLCGIRSVLTIPRIEDGGTEDEI